jgi:cytochrome c biogenesis protein
LQVSHDPTQGWVLGFAIAMFVGLGASLAVKRRRFWARVTPLDTDGDSPAEARDVRRSVVELGGLARTDQAGYGEEFTVISRDLLGRTPQD